MADTTIHADLERLRRSMDAMFAIHEFTLKSTFEAIRESRDEFCQAYHDFKEGLRQDLREFRAGINQKSEIEFDSPKHQLDSQIPDSQTVDSENEFPHHPVIGKISHQMVQERACFLLPFSSVLFAGDGNPNLLIHEIATKGVAAGSEKKSKAEQVTSIARHVFDPMPLRKKLWQNLRTKTFSKTWWFKFKELVVRQEDSKVSAGHVGEILTPASTIQPLSSDSNQNSRSGRLYEQAHSPEKNIEVWSGYDFNDGATGASYSEPTQLEVHNRIWDPGGVFFTDAATSSLRILISFAAKEIDVTKWKGDILAVGVTEKDLAKNENSTFENTILNKLDAHLSGILTEVSSEEDFTGKPGQSTVLRLPGLGSKRIGLIGLVKSVSSPAVFQSLGEALASAAKASQSSSAAIVLASPERVSDESKLSSASAVASGIVLGFFEDSRYKSESKKPSLPSVDITGPGCSIELMKFDMGGSAAVLGAALFLKQFVSEKVQWMHIDMAGPVWNDKKKSGIGFGVAALLNRCRRILRRR